MTPSAKESRITEEEVRHVALLSRLEFDAPELSRFTRELNAILEYVEQLQEVVVSEVPPTSHAIAQVNVLREDAARPSLTNDEALANAPDSEDGCFKVPRIIQDEQT